MLMDTKVFVKHACENVVLADEKQEKDGWYFVPQKGMNPRICSSLVG